MRTKLSAFRSRIWHRGLPAVSAALTAGFASAQDGGNSGTQVIESRPSLAAEIIIVVIMSGLALFAVCRSSRRN